jgi:cobalt-zinc-cadmium efflux system protein
MAHDHGHIHVHSQGGSHRPLLLALCLTFGFAFVEAVAGWWSGSLALLGDAGHMFTDSLSLGLAAGAAMLARRPPSGRHSYGLGRSEQLAALVNALLMIGVVVAIAIEAFARLRQPPFVDGTAVTVVAFLGLLINLGAAWLLVGHGRNVNVRAALLHVIGDLLGSVAALVSGIVIVATGWTPIDPLLSLLIVALILVSAVRVLREAVHALMEGVPLYLDVDQIGRTLASQEGIHSVHDLHVWSLSAERTALSAHLVVADLANWESVLPAARTLLAKRFGIEHVTLQPECLVQHVDIDKLGLSGEGHNAARPQGES